MTKITKSNCGSSVGTPKVQITLFSGSEQEITQYGWYFGIYPGEFDSLDIREIPGEWGYRLSFVLSVKRVMGILTTSELFKILDSPEKEKFKGIKGGAWGVSRSRAVSRFNEFEVFTPYKVSHRELKSL